MNKTEQHLFVLWEKAREKEQEILKEIKAQFTVLKEYEIEWNKDRFLDNLSSFYGHDHTGIIEIEYERGNGKFLVVLVEDNDPLQKNVHTTKGEVSVNQKMYNLKQEIRNEFFEGKYLIHCTNTIEETRHDICLLLGKSLADLLKTETLDGQRVSISQNLPAIDGWKSLEQVFYVLNETCEYAVLRSFELLPGNFHEGDGDIDLMVADPQEFLFTLFPESNHFVDYKKNIFAFMVHLKVGEEVLWLHFKFPLDGYYDFKMSKKILKTRVLNKNNIYIPNDEMLFYELLYHGTILKNNVAIYYPILKPISERINIEFKEDFKYLNNLVVQWLCKNNYKCPMHLDVFRLRQDKNISEKRLIDNDNQLFIYQNGFDTFIFSKWLIACEPNYATTMLSHFGPFNNLEQHLLLPENKLYKEHKKLQKRGEIAWSYKKRFGRVMKTTIIDKPNKPLKIVRNLLGFPKFASSKYLTVKPEPARYMIGGVTVNDKLRGLKELCDIEDLLERFIGTIFDEFKTENSNYLKGTAWDAVPSNCLIDKKENFIFFDREYSYNSDIDKSYMLWRILIYSNMNANKKELYHKFCKQLGLEDKYSWCVYIDGKVHADIWKNPLDGSAKEDFIRNAFGMPVRTYAEIIPYTNLQNFVLKFGKLLCSVIPIKKLRKKTRDSLIKWVKHPHYKTFKRYFRQ